MDSIPQREDLEIIIVDDNSDPEVIDFNNFPGKARPNTKLIFDKKGKGAGAARNIGIKAAKGKWLLFADSDDTYTKHLNSFLDKYKDSNFDAVFFKANVISDSSTKRVVPNMNLFIDSYCKGKSNTDDLKYGAWEPWNRMIRTSVVRDHNICFDEISSSNDKIFSLKLGKYLKTIAVVNEEIYNYILRPGSTIHSGNEKRFLNSFNTIIEQNSIYHEVGYKRKEFIPFFLLKNKGRVTKDILKKYRQYLKRYNANPFEGFFKNFLFHIWNRI